MFIWDDTFRWDDNLRTCSNPNFQERGFTVSHITDPPGESVPPDVRAGTEQTRGELRQLPALGPAQSTRALERRIGTRETRCVHGMMFVCEYVGFFQTNPRPKLHKVSEVCPSTPTLLTD
ncbi:hypothetical protein DPMN_031703 [Dreissena polymorpha]|uniref:Uncharacterized protein n=1 Tax=Dreissena polymorpha TaxID=45954 RepID=A0A9D4M398_DREPO|nr:hypothetical protein DPMN_031703 [Dreissena polymorpha]